MARAKPEMAFYFRGSLERGPNYVFKDGYSPNSDDGNPTYPWLSKLECYSVARTNGCKAVFYRNGKREP